VVIGTLRTPLEGLPRVLISGHPVNSNLGNPGDAVEHVRLVQAAIDLLRSAAEPTLCDLRSERVPART
jgi:hypothetical protein